MAHKKFVVSRIIRVRLMIVAPLISNRADAAGSDTESDIRTWAAQVGEPDGLAHWLLGNRHGQDDRHSRLLDWRTLSEHPPGCGSQSGSRWLNCLFSGT